VTDFERRLDELRTRAAAAGVITDAATGYHGLPLLKAPVWTWEVPAYFFVGGAAGAAAVIGAAANARGGRSDLVRDARWIAAAGAAASAPLLIADLGAISQHAARLQAAQPDVRRRVDPRRVLERRGRRRIRGHGT
jgi:hypothetical protein